MSIELEHSFAVPVPPDQAWDVLLDVQRVAPCMPGATVDEVNGDEVTGKIKVKVGPIALTYTGKARFTERDAATRSIKVEAAGKETRGAGTASATVLARLDEENGQTRVNVHTTLNVTGRPAQFGRGVMADVSGRIIEKFSANLAQQLAAGGRSESVLPNEAVPDNRMAIPIRELNLPARSLNSLKGEGIDTVGELVSRTESELLSIRNLGEKSVGEIEQRLSDLGLALKEAMPYGAASSNGSGPAVDTRGGDAGADSTPGDRAQRDGGGLRAVGGDAGTRGGGGDAGSRGGGGDAGSRGGAGDAGSRGGGGLDAVTSDSNGARPWPAAGLPRDEPEDDALNLLDVAAGPILKRVLPVVATAVVLIWLGVRLRQRSRRDSSG